MKKSEILNALTIVKPGLSNKEIIDQASSFAFMNGNIITYNDEISIQHPVEGLEIEGAIKAEILYGLLSKIKNEEIEFTVNGNELLVVSGKTKAGITFQDKVILPLDEVTERSKWKKLPDGFFKHLQFAADACSSDMSNAKMTCVHIVKEGLFQASDNFKILEIKLGSQMPVNSFLLPASSALIVSKMKPIKISEGPGWIHFMTESRTIISCRLFEDKYPDIARILEVEGIKVSFPKTLGITLERAGVFTKREHVVDENIELTIKNKKMIIKATCDLGWFEESLNMDYSGETFVLNITPYLLKDIISETSDCIIGTNRLKFETEDWVYVSALKNI